MKTLNASEVTFQAIQNNGSLESWRGPNTLDPRVFPTLIGEPMVHP